MIEVADRIVTCSPDCHLLVLRGVRGGGDHGLGRKVPYAHDERIHGLLTIVVPNHEGHRVGSRIGVGVVEIRVVHPAGIVAVVEVDEVLHGGKVVLAVQRPVCPEMHLLVLKPLRIPVQHGQGDHVRYGYEIRALGISKDPRIVPHP